MKHKCSEPGCDREFASEAGMRIHAGQAHKKKTKYSMARPYTRKKKQLEVAVNFCPQCGCNLHAVAMGMALTTGK